jgi:hypothetical protein
MIKTLKKLLGKGKSKPHPSHLKLHRLHMMNEKVLTVKK